MIWEAKARIRHWFGRHTMIAVEIWENGTLSRTHGAECWLCPATT